MSQPMPSYPFLLMTVLLIPLACRAPGSGESSPGGEDASTTHQIIVQTNTPWQDTGIQVDSGQRIAFAASGEYVFHAAGHSCGPGGIPNAQPFTGNWPAKELVGLALIGRISKTGDPFLVGQEAEIQTDRAGEVFLGVNDDIVSENSGTLSVQATIHPAGQTSKD